MTFIPPPPASEALAQAASHPPDIVILDLGLPDIDGVEVIRGLRGWTQAPIVVLSGRTDSSDKVQALDEGADDYLTKPFGVDELLARSARSPAQHLGRGIACRHRSATSRVDLPAKRVSIRRAECVDEVRLTPTEWHLIEVLAKNPGKLMSQRQLLTEVWGPGYETAYGNLRLYMAQLRRKLEADPGRPRYLLTEPGMGYRFEPNHPPHRSRRPDRTR